MAEDDDQRGTKFFVSPSSLPLSKDYSGIWTWFGQRSSVWLALPQNYVIIDQEYLWHGKLEEKISGIMTKLK